jgi:thiol-disulfide isomerase/thioredoxin
MKTMSAIKTNLLWSSITLLLLYSCQSKAQDSGFSLDGKSSLIIKNQTDQVAKIAIENWYLLPWKSQEIDTTLSAGDSISFQMISQGNTYFDITINEHSFKLFAFPNAQNQLVLSEDENGIEFQGGLKSINQFLRNKFNSTGSEWKPRTGITHGDQTFTELIIANDSITQQHQNYLIEHKNDLPQWYVEFENKRLQYLNAHWKLNSLMYRRRMLNRSDSIPENFFENTVGSLKVNDPEMLGNQRYMHFLNDYLGFVGDPFYQKAKPSSTVEWIQFYEDNIETINQELEGEVRDTYLAFSFGSILERRAYLFQNHWVDQITDKALKDYALEIKQSNPILPKGAKAPYFFLPDSAENTYMPNSFKDKIILINFWATWCKPCIKEFPDENRLVEKYEGRPVEIVNICVDSEQEKWKSYIKKYKLKTTNLYASGNWNEKLKKDYGIKALPHSVLIDWNGKVVQNKCPRASENVDEQISLLLEEMKQQD